MANFTGFGTPQMGSGLPQQPRGFPQISGFPQIKITFPEMPGGFTSATGLFPPGFPQAAGLFSQGGFPQDAGVFPPGGFPQAAGGFSLGGFPTEFGASQLIYQWFQAADVNKNGQLNATELQQALANVSWAKFNLETCRYMIALFDRDGNYQIDFNEYQGLWTYIHQWKGVFNLFDRDISGFIDAKELSEALTHLGLRVQPQLCQGLVAKYDYTSGQRLTLDNFIEISVILKSMTDKFKARDVTGQGSIQMHYDDFMSAVMLNKF